jgi:hypothetical protein
MGSQVAAAARLFHRRWRVYRGVAVPHPLRLLALGSGQRWLAYGCPAQLE